MFFLVLLEKDGSPKEAFILRRKTPEGVEKTMNEMGWEKQNDRWKRLTQISDNLFEYSEVAVVLPALELPKSK